MTAVPEARQVHGSAPVTGTSVPGTARLRPEEHDAVGEAVRWAPSIHNSQPWRLRKHPDGLTVLEDSARSVPVIDPAGRDRTISCGAAIFNAWISLRTLGHDTAVNLLPDPLDPAALATLHRVGPRAPSEQEDLLHRMIPLRHTHRRVYRSNVVAEDDLLELRRAVSAEGARLSVADPAARRRLAGLLRRAAYAQAADTEIRREVEQWVRRGTPDRTVVDGIPSNALGTSPFPVDSLVHGGTRGVPEAEEVEAELARSTVLVLSTREDTRRDWVTAGMALERLLLTATAMGLVAAFAEQPLQDPQMRPQVADALEIWGHPQLLLRVGRPLVDAVATPRRPLTELFE
ncbi:MAG: nitroreductase family protein [Kineosporiaceae bacterium]|jgi:nitroreductase